MLQLLKDAGFLLQLQPEIYLTRKAWRRTDSARIDFECEQIQNILTQNKVSIYTHDPSISTDAAIDTFRLASMRKYTFSISNTKTAKEFFGIDSIDDLRNQEIQCEAERSSATIRSIRGKGKFDERVHIDPNHNNRAMIRIGDPEKLTNVALQFYDLSDENRLTVNFTWQRDGEEITKNIKLKCSQSQASFHMNADDVLSPCGKLKIALVQPKEKDVNDLYSQDDPRDVQHITTDTISNIDAMKTCMAELAIRNNLNTGKLTLIPAQDIVPGTYFTGVATDALTCLEIFPDGRLRISRISPESLGDYSEELLDSYMEAAEKQEVKRKKSKKQQSNDSTYAFWMGLLTGGRPYRLIDTTGRQMIPSDEARSEESRYSRKKDYREEVASEYGLCWRYTEKGLEYSSGLLEENNRQRLSGYPNVYLLESLDGAAAGISPETLYSWLFS